MSYADLRPWFPSASHPALPAASSILATLRHLTGPGKGNELKPEERAALIGVSALLGCEKVQNKDLVERTAQKASSVAPAHFRSALRRARILLAEAESQAEQSDSTPRRRSARGESSASASALTSGSSSAQASPIKPSHDAPAASSAGTEIDALSPFSTPKKKFKYSSGVDLSGLIRHSPSKGSPLKQSLIPGKAGTRVPERQRQVRGERAEGRAALAEEVEGADEGMDVDVDEDGRAGGYEAGAQASDGGDGGDGEDDPMGDEQNATPTKVRPTRATGPGVTGSNPHPAAAAAASSAAMTTSISRRARAEDLSAFLALRPGATPAAKAQQPVSAQRAATEHGNGTHIGFEEALGLRHGRGRPRAGFVERHQVRGKRDRTGKELRWGVEEVQRRHEGVLKRLEGLFERYERSQGAA